MQDGEQKGFAEVQLEVIQQVGGACLRANKFEQELRKSLKEIKDPSHKDRKQPISIEQLLGLQREAKELRVWLPEEEELAQIINEVDSFDTKCKLILARAELLKQADLDDGPTFLSEVLDLEQQVRRLGVSNPTFRAFRQFTKPLRRWIHYSRSLIKTYLRSVTREFPQSLAQLDLLPQQDYESDSSGCEGERAVPDHDHDMLTLVLRQTQTDLRVLQSTTEFKILQEIEARVAQWIENASNLESEASIVETLERLSNEFLPLPVNL